MIIKWLGHASFKIKNKKIIYIDPFVGDYDEKADLILITHSHYDHSSRERISEIRKENTKIVTTIENAGNIYGSDFIEASEEKEFNGVKILGIEAYNIKRRKINGEPFHPKGFGIGFLIQLNGKKIYHAGDTDFVPEIENLKDKKLDIALLPIGGTYTMDLKEAIECAKAILPKIVIPMHFTSEEIKGPIDLPQDVDKFKKELESTSDIKVIVLKPLEEIEI